MSFSSKLIDWYLQNKRDLPWRLTKDAYKIWLSEIMLQQTRVAQGLDYFKTFENHFPTVFDLAKADEQLVLKLWQGLGYYSRARNLHYTAKYIVEHHDGKFPSEFSEIKKLKGVGDYTASAIASIAFDKPHAVVDGNVYRVLSRVFGIDTPINSTEGIKEFKSLAQSLIDTNQPGTYNQAIMEFGAMQCKPKNPNCEDCPLQNMCIAFEKKQIDQLPVKLKKTKVRNRFFNYLVVLSSDGKTILNQRTQKGIWQNLYEFPLIETEDVSNEKEIIGTQKFKNYGFENFELSLYNEMPIVHKLSHQHLHTQFWILEIQNDRNSNINWEEIDNYPVPVLIANFLKSFRPNMKSFL
ncbi:MAG: A/G-specific adenine glycosylase [Polaribacter sp.]